jgi:hypothetical protein
MNREARELAFGSSVRFPSGKLWSCAHLRPAPSPARSAKRIRAFWDSTQPKVLSGFRGCLLLQSAQPAQVFNSLEKEDAGSPYKDF